MGLDSVELVMALEEAFEVELPDDEVSRVSTAGDLHALILSKLTTLRSGPCLTSVAFYRTRKGLVELLGVDRKTIRPATPLAPLLPSPGRRRQWALLEAILGLKLPGLQMQAWALFLFPGAGAAAGLFLGSRLAQPALQQAAFTVVGVFAGALALGWASPLFGHLPRELATVGDLARSVLALNAGRLSGPTRAWTESEVWSALCRIICEQMGIPPESIRPEATIVGDLGIS